MKACGVILVNLLVIQCLLWFCVSETYDYFYFVEQWGPSYCNLKKKCCFPTTGKPATNFTIRGLWPHFPNGLPSSCNSAVYNETKLVDLISPLQKSWPTLACPSGNGTKFWKQEWTKYGACTSLDQHSYFEAALKLKDKVNLLQVLENAGIKPGGFYNLTIVKEAIKRGTGYDVAIQCNKNKEGKDQIYLIYLCADSSASKLIQCPKIPERRCNATIGFPSYNSGVLMQGLQALNSYFL